MEKKEVILAEQKTEMLSNAFSDTEAFNKIYKIGTMFASSALVPDNYQNKPMDCVIAVDMANRMGVSPMMVMQNLYVVKGKPSWSGQACMSLIEGSGKFKGVRPVYFGEKGTDERGCRIEAVWADTGEKVVGTEITIKMAKDEGWYSKKDKYGNETSKWQTMPEQMLAYRAASFFARVYIPNALMGVYVEGEVEDIDKEPRRKAPDPFNEGGME